MPSAHPSDDLPVIEPGLQVSFYYRLQSMRGLYLREALGTTVANLDIKRLDRQLAECVSRKSLSRLAKLGLRRGGSCIGHWTSTGQTGQDATAGQTWSHSGR